MISISDGPLLDVQDLHTDFMIKRGLFQRSIGAIHAVQEVNLTLNRGETIGIVGESGSGKTTLAKTIIRLLTPSKGKILLHGQNIASLPMSKLGLHQRSRIQMVFQDPYSSLNPRQKVYDALEEPIRIHFPQYRTAHRKEVIETLLLQVGIDPKRAYGYPHEFSGGQRQRISIARALSVEPEIIIADEPVSALDVSIQAQILELFKSLQMERDLSYLFISHDLSVIRHIATHVMVMYLGRIMEVAPRDAFFTGYHHPYTQALISAVPQLPRPGIKAKPRILLNEELPDPANPPKGCVFHTRCIYAQEICKTNIPPLVQIGIKHSLACHFPC
jgi:oligopeptide/dipeptide ABC transporter ATP-binding protein